MTTDKKNNNHALIIGGSSGVGNKLAVKLSKQGAVSVLARRNDRLRDLESKSENIYSCSSDVTSYETLFESIKNCVQNHGKINKLIYCAGKQIIHLAAFELYIWQVPSPKMGYLKISDALETNYCLLFFHNCHLSHQCPTAHCFAQPNLTS